MGCGCKKTTAIPMPPKVVVAPKTNNVKPAVTIKSS